jgi:hypothetical protein
VTLKIIENERLSEDQEELLRKETTFWMTVVSLGEKLWISLGTVVLVWDESGEG